MPSIQTSSTRSLSRYTRCYPILQGSLDLTASKSLATPPIDGVIGYVSQTPVKSSSKQKSVSNIGSNDPSRNSLDPGKTSKVHVVQSTTADKNSKGKNNGKGKAKFDAPKQGPPKSSIGDASQRKPKCPLNIVPDDLKLVACSKGPRMS